MIRNPYGARISGSPDPDFSVPRFVAGTIQNIDTERFCCSVVDDSGSMHEVAFPNLQQDPEGSGGEILIPRIGQRVELRIGGRLTDRIVGFLPVSLDENISQIQTQSVSNASPAVTVKKKSFVNFRGNFPQDLMPGDWLRFGNDGQYLGILDKGIAILHGGAWANIRAIGSVGGLDTLKITGRITELQTDFGYLTFGSTDGKTFMEFKGGTDQSLETGIDRQNWTVESGIGLEGLYFLRFKDRLGENLFEHKLDDDGNLDYFLSGNKNELLEGNLSQAIKGNFSQETNNFDRTVNGDTALQFLGNVESNISLNRYCNILANDSLLISENYFLSSKTLNILSSGRPLYAVPGDTAVDWKVANGDFKLEIGKPPSDFQKSLSGFKLNVYPPGAEINLNCLAGSLKFNAGLNGSFSSTGPMSLDSKATFDISALAALNLSSQASVLLKSPLVKMGSNAANQAAVKGTIFLSQLKAFLNAVSSIVPGNDTANATALGIIKAAASSLAGSLDSSLSTKIFLE